MKKQEPYIIREVTHIVREYNPEYGDDRICECGHSYYRHFDSWDNMEPVGCKYCSCYEFIEVKPGQKTRGDAEDDGYSDGFSGLEKRTEYESTKWKDVYDNWYEYGINKRKSREFKF